MEKKGKKILDAKIIFNDTEEKSLFTILVKDLQLFDQEYFLKNFRMDTKSFEELLSCVAPFIHKSPLKRPAETAQECR